MYPYRTPVSGWRFPYLEIDISRAWRRRLAPAPAPSCRTCHEHELDSRSLRPRKRAGITAASREPLRKQPSATLSLWAGRRGGRRTDRDVAEEVSWRHMTPTSAEPAHLRGGALHACQQPARHLRMGLGARWACDQALMHKGDASSGRHGDLHPRRRAMRSGTMLERGVVGAWSSAAPPARRAPRPTAPPPLATTVAEWRQYWKSWS